MNDIKRQIRNQVRDQIEVEIQYSIDSKINSQVDPKIKKQIWTEVGGEVWNQVKNDIWNEQIISGVYKFLNDADRELLVHAMRCQIEIIDQIHIKIWEQITNHILNELDKQTKLIIMNCPQISNENFDRIFNQLKNQIKH